MKVNKSIKEKSQKIKCYMFHKYGHMERDCNMARLRLTKIWKRKYDVQSKKVDEVNRRIIIENPKKKCEKK